MQSRLDGFSAGCVAITPRSQAQPFARLLLTFLDYMVDAQSGAVIARGISRSVRWNPTGTHLLEKQANPFIRWQQISLIEAATGKRTVLGHGDMLGWTSSTEAWVIRWDESAQLPPPGKGCLP